MAQPRMTNTEFRTMIRIWPASRLTWHIRSTRETMQRPQIPARNGYMASGPDVILCARHIGMMRAEQKRRWDAGAKSRIACGAWTAPDGPQLAAVQAKVRAFESAACGSKGG